MKNHMQVIHLIALTDVPVSCFSGDTDLGAKVRSLRNRAEPWQGFFLLRNISTKNPASSFVLKGDLRYNGRWLLGKIDYNPVIQNMWEIAILRKNSMYYSCAMAKGELANTMRYLAEDGDEDIQNCIERASPVNGDWDISFQTSIFDEYGFTFPKGAVDEDPNVEALEAGPSVQGALLFND